VPPSIATYDSGAVRRYNVNPDCGSEYKTFTYFIQPHDAGGPLEQPWYLTFGETKSDTLAYPTRKPDCVCASGVAPVSHASALATDTSGNVLLSYFTPVNTPPTGSQNGSAKAPVGQSYVPALPPRVASPVPAPQAKVATANPLSPTGTARDSVFAGFHGDLLAPVLVPFPS
jgi:hypothetical protein